METNSRVEFIRMIWYGYLPQIVAGILTLWVLKISYFYIQRRYTQPSVVYQNSSEDSDVFANSENLFNESSLESLSLDREKKTMDINNVTGCSGYGSTEGEMQESKNYITTQDVTDTCTFNSGSHSSIMLWESCHEEVSYSELDLNCLSSENNLEICQPLNLCMRDIKNETSKNKMPRTFFTDRKHKTIKGIQKIDSEKYLVTKKIEDPSLKNKVEYDLDNTEYELNHENNLEITKLSSINQGELEDEYNLSNVEHELRVEHTLEITELSSTYQGELEDEYNLNIIEHGLRDEHTSEITNLSSIYQDKLEDEYNLNNIEHGLRDEHTSEITNLSSIYQDKLEDEYNLNNIEHGLRDEHTSEITNLSSIYQDKLEDEYNLDNIELEIKNKNKLEITKINSIHREKLKDELSVDKTEHELRVEHTLEITELSSIHHEELEDEYRLNNREHSLNDDHMMLANGLETTGLSPIHQDEQNYEYNFLTSPELSSLNNDKSISGIDSPNIKCHHDYEVQDINEFNNTSSSECTESFPSPIFNNDSSVDDIQTVVYKESILCSGFPLPSAQYVEDYNDISFFGSTLSDDAMNEAFVED